MLHGRRAERFAAVEVGAFFDGVGPDSGDDEPRRIAPDHPVFRIQAPRR